MCTFFTTVLFSSSSCFVVTVISIHPFIHSSIIIALLIFPRSRFTIHDMFSSSLTPSIAFVTLFSSSLSCISLRPFSCNCYLSVLLSITYSYDLANFTNELTVYYTYLLSIN
ncbi:hypothetical protein DFP72DRAFT_251975 [Ephemerocybe angulata]|uniref:Uncharacterized protein n=1 Tax=Ephemerocybe angulata TaxID=980116 RepID=A0A8H6M8W6_9AGAR|nr:hypothetical protein DFP72DRAFT_251975 [Tulosesus angulatus]